MHLKHATFRFKLPKRTRPRRSGSRLHKTKKKWIDGSRVEDQEVWKIQERKPKNHSLYRCPGWGRWRSLQVAKSSPVWGSSSLPSSSDPVPAYLIQYSSSIHYSRVKFSCSFFVHYFCFLNFIIFYHYHDFFLMYISQ